MRSFELTYESLNTASYAKRLTLLAIAPERMGPETGAMLFSHGWGGNRFQYQAAMAWAAEACDLVCVAVEFRQSGYDFNAVTGTGAGVPYDASFYQVFDVLNGLRALLDLLPGINRRRLFSYGGSQGGHIALLAAVYAPATFAMVYAASPVVHLNAEPQQSWAGRGFAPWELAARDVLAHAGAFRCPVILEHGTADQTVDCQAHTQALEARLRALGKPVRAFYYEGGGHGLEPVTNRLETFQRTAPDDLRTLTNAAPDDFLVASQPALDCGQRQLRIDWSRPAPSVELFAWR